MLLVRPARVSGAAGAQRAVAQRAAVVHGLSQDPVDLLAQLDDVRRRHPALVPRRRRKHVLVQRAPKDGNVGIVSTGGRVGGVAEEAARWLTFGLCGGPR